MASSSSPFLPAAVTRAQYTGKRCITIHNHQYFEKTAPSEQPAVYKVLPKFRSMNPRITRRDFVGIAVVYPRLYQLGASSQRWIQQWRRDNEELLQQCDLDLTCPNWFNSEERDREDGLTPRQAGLDPALWNLKSEPEPDLPQQSPTSPQLAPIAPMAIDSILETPLVVDLTGASPVDHVDQADYTTNEDDETYFNYRAAIRQGKQPVHSSPAHTSPAPAAVAPSDITVPDFRIPVKHEVKSTRTARKASIIFDVSRTYNHRQSVAPSDANSKNPTTSGRVSSALSTVSPKTIRRRRYRVTNGPVALVSREEINELFDNIEDVRSLSRHMLDLQSDELPSGLQTAAGIADRNLDEAMAVLDGYRRTFSQQPEVHDGNGDGDVKEDGDFV